MSERSTESGTSPPPEPPPSSPHAVSPAPGSPFVGRTTDDESRPIDLGDDPFVLTGPDDTEPERASLSRTRTIVLGALLAVGLAGAGFIATTVWRVSAQKDATLTAPPEIATLRIDESDNGLQTADYLTTALAAEVDLEKTVGAVYTDSEAGNRGVLFFGGTGLIWTPEADLDTAFDLISDDQGAVTGLHDVEPGALGGTMKCGTTKSDEADIVVCGWADHGSLALGMFPNRSGADSAKLFLEIRSAAQTRQ